MLVVIYTFKFVSFFGQKNWYYGIMSRVCDVTGRRPMYGNNVSHAHNKSRRRFDINLQKKRFWLADENRWITLNVSTQGLRLIDKIGIRKVLNKMRAEGKKV